MSKEFLIGKGAKLKSLNFSEHLKILKISQITVILLLKALCPKFNYSNKIWQKCSGNFQPNIASNNKQIHK
jgi:hypothetical protein